MAVFKNQHYQDNKQRLHMKGVNLVFESLVDIVCGKSLEPIS